MYTLGIGELIENDNYPSVKKIERKDAPATGLPTDFTNYRCPSYMGWIEFMRAANIPFDMFIKSHPGSVPITLNHKSIVDESYKILYNKLHTYDKERLIWLKYWIDYSIENIEAPYFTNS